MKQILTICALLLVLLIAGVGSMVIFDVINVDTATSVALKFGGAIVLLGVCSALVMTLMGGGKGTRD